MRKLRRFLVYVDIDYNRLQRKVKVGQLLVTDADGELVFDMVGGTMGYHEGRASLRKFKLIVKNFVDAELEDHGVRADVSLGDIAFKNYDEIEEIMSKTRNGIYSHLREFR